MEASASGKTLRQIAEIVFGEEFRAAQADP